MNIPIEEVFMLLGEKIVQIHERDKQIRALEIEITKLREETRVDYESIREASNG